MRRKYSILIDTPVNSSYNKRIHTANRGNKMINTKWTSLARKYVTEIESLKLNFEDSKKYLEQYTARIEGSRYYFSDTSSIDFWLAYAGKGAAIVYGKVAS